MSYKPEQAVMLIVWTSGGAMLHSVLADTIRPIGSSSELDYIRANLTQRQIPWDETNAANDDISGFGTRMDTLASRIADAVWAKALNSKVSSTPLAAADMLAYIDQHTAQ